MDIAMQEPTRPILRYFGGKWKLAPWIISNLPKHRVYVEPFGGAASVLMRKPRAYAEVYNDLDKEVVNLFRVVRNPITSAELQRRLWLTPFSRDEFDLSYEWCDEAVEGARRLIIRSFMGFGADGHNVGAGKTGFRADSNKSGSTPAHDWANFPEQISRFCERMTGVVIENRDALEVMSKHDSEGTLHFVDPPYMHETRSKKHRYRHEMSDVDHASLCEFLNGLKGMVVLCGYETELYSDLGWRMVKRISFADGARERVECLWLNSAAIKAQGQVEFDI